MFSFKEQSIPETPQDKFFSYFCLSATLFLSFMIHVQALYRGWSLMQDEALYAWYANNIHASAAFLFSPELWQCHPPLFSLILQLGHFVSPPEMGYRMVCLLISLLGIFAIFRLGKKIAGTFLGIFAAIALTFNDIYFWYWETIPVLIS